MEIKPRTKSTLYRIEVKYPEGSPLNERFENNWVPIHGGPKAVKTELRYARAGLTICRNEEAKRDRPEHQRLKFRIVKMTGSWTATDE